MSEYCHISEYCQLSEFAHIARMRLRIPELLEARGWNAYRLAKESDGRISQSTAHRLVADRGNLRLFSADVLETLCDILEVEPGELFERATPPRKATPQRRRK